jgi:hypothetical protein
MADAAFLTKLVSREMLMRAVGRALRAPSVHNSQPWQWRISDGVVELHADPDRHQIATDPDRRDLVISCGAKLHQLRVALADLGVATTTQWLPDPEDSTLLAVVPTVDGPSTRPTQHWRPRSRSAAATGPPSGTSQSSRRSWTFSRSTPLPRGPD